MSWIDELTAFINRLLGGGTPPPPVTGNEPLQVISPRVMVINFNPVVASSGKRLTEKMGWSNVDQLINGFIADIDEVSYGLVKYQYNPANRIDVNAFPRKTDGFQYTPAAYLAMMQNEPTHHEPDGVDYWQILNDYNVVNRVVNNEIDEVWLFGGPYFGFWESTMAGKGAIWCNSAALAGSESIARRFVIMGFNYQRGVAEMVHNVGHRTESIMAHVYDSFNKLMSAYAAVNPAVQPPVSPSQFANPKNDFERFMLYEKIAPGRAQVGLIHTPPNADKDYDWANPALASSNADDWLNYPAFLQRSRAMNCSEWGCGGDGYEYTKWWFKRVPHAAGSQNGILNNWWRYVMRVDLPFRAGE